MKTENLIGSDIEKIAKSRRTFESGHVKLSESAWTYWQKTAEDPCFFFVMHTTDGRARLTHKEWLTLFDFSTRNPTYLSIPLHLNSDSAKEIMKTDYDLSINF